MKKSKVSSAILGAAFLMATSAVGPGFLTQTALFTKRLMASFAFVILLSVLLDIVAQLNIWRILTVTGKRGQEIANRTVPGSGYVLAALVVFGGLAFNVGNVAGCGLGLNVLFGLPVSYGAGISAAIAIAIFVYKEAGWAMDLFVKLLGVLMIGLILYVVFASSPPVGEAALRSVWPEVIDPAAIVTLVGGTVGGYITFAGAHRLIDAGISGQSSLKLVNRSAITGILLTATVRILLFLAALGVLSMGMTIDDSNPPASVFQNAAGNVGYRMFGIVMWAAAITSVVGAAYTSVSFFKTFAVSIERRHNLVVVAFILISLCVFLFIGQPVSVLVWAGTINGFILPLGLALILLAPTRKAVIGEYSHPKWLWIAGWLVVAIMAFFSFRTLVDSL